MLWTLAATLGLVVGLTPAWAETGEAAWLRYQPIQDPAVRRRYDSMPSAVVTLGDSEVLRSARLELVRGVGGMLGRRLSAEPNHTGPNLTEPQPPGGLILLGTLVQLRGALPSLRASGLGLPSSLPEDAYWLTTTEVRGSRLVVIAGSNERGVLYGVFGLLRKISLNQPLVDEAQAPYASIRWVNDWDNLDGSIERGYGGRSIFFENGHVAGDLARAGEYARLLASVGVNGCAVNNVNADRRLIAPGFLPELGRLAEAFRPWGVRLAVSVDFSSPQTLGGLGTFDPLDPRAAAWWKETFDRLYAAVPDLGGVVLKADSEGRLGPSAYGRTPADAANVIARALGPHGGLVFYRAFVYNHHLDWRDPKNDRARAAYDIFHPLDGRFEPNVVVQIKNGPIDFQVREPASPLLGGLKRSNEALELQITQEYTGQQRHLCFLAPMWKETLDFDLQARGPGTPVKALAAGKIFDRPVGGFVGVANVGREPTWLGSHLAMANLYAFGRLAWNPDLGARAIAEEWTRQTFGNDPQVVPVVTGMEVSSWQIYENYTGPLGIGTLTDILGSHYGPGIESAERNGWGQWIRADRDGLGMDRTEATGTGYIGQYAPGVARLYESLANCPDALLLFMHHVPYSYRLHAGPTVIQYIYDSHYAGAEQAADLVTRWRALHGRIDDERYREVLARLTYQSGHAIVWRDAVCNWFLRESGVPDSTGRAGRFPGRFEAEDMTLTGYQVADVTPWETASGGKAVTCARADGCSAAFRYRGPAGNYNMSVGYFDQNNGASRFELWIGGRPTDRWTADDTLPASTMNGSSATRHTVTGLALRPGDEIRVEGVPDAAEPAPLDYVELRPSAGPS
ncbi:MAG TPA: alpha-glucuronidase family glycosyl hydrolase [Terriglobia bacterium]|nr:alpha-glucuronidase family glycosyl hydrolase [Terriglobia bacterium]